ncbi:MAG: two-component system sensor histidine kinase NtrB [Limisphaerales bacterium]
MYYKATCTRLSELSLQFNPAPERQGFRPAWACLILGMLLAFIPAQGADAPAKPRVLTSAVQVLSLSPEEAETGLPVRLRGLVSLYQPNLSLFFVQDPTGGVYLFDEVPHPDVRSGQWVEVEGVTGKGRGTPILLGPQVRLLSASEFVPPIIRPRPVSLEIILAGRSDEQWVQLTGAVRRAWWDKPYLALRFGPKQSAAVALVPQPFPPTNLTGLLRAQVSVRGVCVQRFDRQGRIEATSLFAAAAEDFQVLACPAEGPFEAPLRSVGGCFEQVRFTDNDPWVRTKGTVIAVLSNGSFYLDDGQRGIEVRPCPGVDVRTGDDLEVAAYIVPNGHGALLEDAIVRKLGTSLPLEPLALSLQQARNRETEARLVTLEARLLDHVQQQECEFLTVAALGTTFTAELRTTNRAGTLTAFQPDSVLRLTGIWLGRQGDDPDSRYRLRLRDAADARLLHSPSWWTSKHILLVVSALTAACLLASAWAMLLNSQVRQKTEEVRRRLEKEAELEQRFRDLIENANDMICTLSRDGRLTSANRAAERIFGYSRQELTTRPLSDFVAPDSLPNLQQILAANPKTGSVDMAELKVTARDGSDRTLEIDSRRFGSAGVQVIARDVTERKRAEARLAGLQSEMWEVSRKAGMADVASAILHNVGNVLNSVNVSAGIVARMMRTSSRSGVTKMAGLLEEHRRDLAGFFAVGGRTEQVIAYLKALDQQLSSEQATVLKELRELSGNIEHINNIVATQQSYARIGGVVEEVSAAHLLDDALRINATLLKNHQVQVVRQYDPRSLPMINVDKHRVLQILINLIRNAVYACEESGRADKCLTLRAANADGRIKFLVADNGVGIPAENLTRIFNHGFTTRKDGHGFGLHSGALAARAMGGDLRAESDGPARGASFTLELPTQPALPR